MSSFTQVIPFKGKSMFPLIKEGDRIVVDFYSEPKRVNVKLDGKICLYNDGNEWVAHRVICFKNSAYVKGDFAKSFDNKTDLLLWGQVTQIQTSGGKIINLKISHFFDGLSAKLSLIHMLKVGLLGRISKFLLCIINSVRRYFSTYKP